MPYREYVHSNHLGVQELSSSSSRKIWQSGRQGEGHSLGRILVHTVKFLDSQQCPQGYSHIAYKNDTQNLKIYTANEHNTNHIQILRNYESCL